jgi:uncharacterized protein (DUF1330 family)
MPAYMISLIDVKDADGFAAYLAQSKDIAGEFGAKMVLAAGYVGAINGTLPTHQRVVVAEFPDVTALDAWKTSAAYQALVPLRESSSTQIMTTYQAA